MTPAVAAVLDRAAELTGVVAVVDPYTSGRVDATETIGLISVSYAKGEDELTGADRDAFDELAAAGGPRQLRVVPGGMSASPPEVGAIDAIGVLIATVVLMVTFGSLLAAGMTLLTALVGVLAGMGGLLMVTAVADVSSSAPILALMLGLAVGIDYALFISFRHRAQVKAGMDAGESVARAIATAGSAVLFAGAMVVVALAGLGLVGVPFLTAMGLAAAGTVFTAVLVALTLVPAMLGFVGGRILPRTPAAPGRALQGSGGPRIPLGRPGDAMARTGAGGRGPGVGCAEHPGAGPAAGAAGERDRPRGLAPAGGL